MSTLFNRLADILVLSLRPAQLMLCAAAFGMAFSILGIHVLHHAQYLPFISNWIIVALFGGYGSASAYCSFVTKRSKHDELLRKLSASVGIGLWSIAFAVEMLTHDADSMVVHVMPICAEAWALAQIASKVREQDRRAL
jgi:predicted membrane-bound spermidine synthase